nr:RNA-dependent RNA polymerase [Riboviria sp.]
MLRLPPAKGFAQKFEGDVQPTPYLPPHQLLDQFQRGTVTIKRIREDVQSFGNTLDLRGDEIPRNLRYAISRARQAFSCGMNDMIHLNDLFHYPLKIWSSSPGLPWINYGYRSKKQVANDVSAIRGIRWFWHRIKNGGKVSAPDCLAYVRSHIAEPGEHKIRAVWGYPMTLTMGEAVFAVPLIERYQNMGGNSPIAYGYETALGGAQRVLSDLRGSKYKGSLDFKSFDKTVPSFLIREAFDILAMNINFCDYRDYGVADARRNIRMFEYIRDYFVHTPIRLCDGQRFLKCGGVASGSYFTQLVDSVVNYILISWACLEQHGHFPNVLKVLGDDSFFGTNERFDLDDANDLFQTIGMRVNVAKSQVSRDIENLSFLGYDISSTGIPSKPHAKWIAALYYPERKDVCWDDVASRALGLLYANAGVDDEFDRYCRAIIAFRSFDIHLPRSLVRMLFAIGVTSVSVEPPDRWQLWQRLRII